MSIGQLGHHPGLHVTVDVGGKTVGARALPDVAPGGVPEEILALVRAGKTLQAVKRYRTLNGATLDEARAFTATL